MERLRWLAHDFGDRYILVNIPDFHLYAYDSGRLALTMRVVVGKDYKNPTPVFSDTMAYVVFRPFWNVPKRIINEELLPAQKKDTAYLNKHQYEVLKGTTVVDPGTIDWAKADTLNFRYLIRQKPGGQNSLGHIKFMLPNQYDVYLHDTPSQGVFRRAGRNASHGCIRVEKPQQLAEYAMVGVPKWDKQKIRDAMRDTTPPEEVHLVHRVPVYIVYLTAFVENGVVQFRNDLYGNDDRAITRLEAVRPDSTPTGMSRCEELMRLVGGAEPAAVPTASQ